MLRSWSWIISIVTIIWIVKISIEGAIVGWSWLLGVVFIRVIIVLLRRSHWSNEWLGYGSWLFSEHIQSFIQILKNIGKVGGINDSAFFGFISLFIVRLRTVGGARSTAVQTFFLVEASLSWSFVPWLRTLGVISRSGGRAILIFWGSVVLFSFNISTAAAELSTAAATELIEIFIGLEFWMFISWIIGTVSGKSMACADRSGCFIIGIRSKIFSCCRWFKIFGGTSKILGNGWEFRFIWRGFAWTSGSWEILAAIINYSITIIIIVISIRDSGRLFSFLVVAGIWRLFKRIKSLVIGGWCTVIVREFIAAIVIIITIVWLGISEFLSVGWWSSIGVIKARFICIYE